MSGIVASALVLQLVVACTGKPPPPVEVPEPAGIARELAKVAPGLKPVVAERAVRAYVCASRDGLVGGETLTVIDYALPSTDKRLWVLDMVSKKLLFHELVAHGRGSGDDVATKFSNVPGSKTSSIGLFRTLGTYSGKHGYSLKLRGLEPGINDNAEARSIVIHGASYVSPAFAKKHGRLGRSWGCPALEKRLASDVIDAIKGGTAVLVHYPDASWLRSSAMLHCPK